MSTARLLGDSLTAMGRYKLRSGFMMLGTLRGRRGADPRDLDRRGRRAQDPHHRPPALRRLVDPASSRAAAACCGGPRGEAARLTLDDMEAVAGEVPGIEVWDPQQVMSDGAGAAMARPAPRCASSASRSARARLEPRRLARRVLRRRGGGGLGARGAHRRDRGARAVRRRGPARRARSSIGSVALSGDRRSSSASAPTSTAWTATTRSWSRSRRRCARLKNVDTIRGGQARSCATRTQSRRRPREVKRVLRERHGLADGQPDDFTLITAVAGAGAWWPRSSASCSSTCRSWRASRSLVGGVVAASLMLASVNERMGEIGLRRAVGARPVDIRLQFLLETAVTTLGGGLGGVLVGCGRRPAARLTGSTWADVFSWPAVAARARGRGGRPGFSPASCRRGGRRAWQPADALR